MVKSNCVYLWPTGFIRVANGAIDIVMFWLNATCKCYTRKFIFFLLELEGNVKAVRKCEDVNLSVSSFLIVGKFSAYHESCVSVSVFYGNSDRKKMLNM